MMPDQASNRASTSPSSISLFGLDSERVAPYVLAILIIYAAIRNFLQAATRPFWYDEICTFLMVRQRSISTLWSALKNGADGQPPGFYLVERIATKVAVNESIAFRWLSIFSFSLTVLCLFILIRKKRGSTIALFCALILFITPLYDTYAVEARPYSLVVACIAFALLCYERAPAVRWTILLGLSLALAQSFHYYAAFAFLPFFAAEATIVLVERRLRWGVWFALACGFLPLLAFWPMLAKSKAIYGKYFWSLPTFQMAKDSYGWYLNTSITNGVTITGLSAVAILGTILYARRRAASGKIAATISLQDAVMALTFLSLPFIGFVATKLAHGGMLPKYLFPTLLGFPLAAGYALPRLGRKSSQLIPAITLLLLLVIVLREKSYWSTYTGHFSSPAAPVEPFVAKAGHDDLPVVISDAGDFMQLAHYASPDWAKRFVAIVDPQLAVSYIGTDNADKELLILASYSQLRVYDFKAFVAEHPNFLLYSSEAGMGNDWWPRSLPKEGFTLRPVAVKPKSEGDFYHRVFLVTRPTNAD